MLHNKHGEPFKKKPEKRWDLKMWSRDLFLNAVGSEFQMLRETNLKEQCPKEQRLVPRVFVTLQKVESKQDDKKLTKGEDSPQNGCWQGTAILNYDHVLDASPVTWTDVVNVHILISAKQVLQHCFGPSANKRSVFKGDNWQQVKSCNNEARVSLWKMQVYSIYRQIRANTRKFPELQKGCMTNRANIRVHEQSQEAY